MSSDCGYVEQGLYMHCIEGVLVYEAWGETVTRRFWIGRGEVGEFIFCIHSGVGRTLAHSLLFS